MGWEEQPQIPRSAYPIDACRRPFDAHLASLGACSGQAGAPKRSARDESSLLFRQTSGVSCRGSREQHARSDSSVPGVVSLLYRHGLGQVSWLVYVAASSYGYVVGEELEGDDVEDR